MRRSSGLKSELSPTHAVCTLTTWTHVFEIILLGPVHGTLDVKAWSLALQDAMHADRKMSRNRMLTYKLPKGDTAGQPTGTPFYHVAFQYTARSGWWNSRGSTGKVAASAAETTVLSLTLRQPDTRRSGQGWEIRIRRARFHELYEGLAGAA